jgi:protein required for attachment to host cells
LFTVERPADSRFEGGPELVEHVDLVNPEGELTGEELFSDLKSGLGHASGGGPAHRFDDHRSQHQAEIARRFARFIVEAALRFVRERGANRLVIVAEPRMLGFLRAELDATKHGLRLDELAHDMSWHAVSHIQDVLTERGLVAARKAPSLAYRPPGQPPPSTES